MANPLKLMADRYRRWRHSRGYGIHSPLAYTLVTEALYLRHGYAYYRETDPRLDADSPGTARRARALYRLITVLRRDFGSPLPVYLAPSAPACHRKAALLAGACLVNKPESARCAVLPPATPPRPQGDCPDLDCGRHEIPKSGRLIFLGRHWTIVISGHQMADTVYILP